MLNKVIKEALDKIASGEKVDKNLIGQQAVYMALALNYEQYKAGQEQIKLMKEMIEHLSLISATVYIDPLDKVACVRYRYGSYMDTKKATDTIGATPIISKKSA